MTFKIETQMEKFFFSMNKLTSLFIHLFMLQDLQQGRKDEAIQKIESKKRRIDQERAGGREAKHNSLLSYE